MGNIGFPELLVILVVAFLVIGPRRLPELARALGEAVRAFRQALQPGEGDRAYTPKLPAEDAPLPPLDAPEHSTTHEPFDSASPRSGRNPERQSKDSPYG